jgi:hypothetical protein
LAKTATRTFAGAGGEGDDAAHHLVRVAGIDAEVQRDFDGLVELGRRQALHQADGFIDGVEFLAIDLADPGFAVLGQLCHVLSPPQPGGPSRGRCLR